MPTLANLSPRASDGSSRAFKSSFSLAAILRQAPKGCVNTKAVARHAPPSRMKARNNRSSSQPCPPHTGGTNQPKTPCRRQSSSCSAGQAPSASKASALSESRRQSVSKAGSSGERIEDCDTMRKTRNRTPLEPWLSFYCKRETATRQLDRATATGPFFRQEE